MQLSRRSFLYLASVSGAMFVTQGVLRTKPVFAANKYPFAEQDAVGLANAIKKGDASPLEVLDAAIARIDRLNPTLNAVVTKAYDEARTKAKQGKFDGPFAGVPTLIKDLNDVAGIRTTNGCRALVGRVPSATEPYIQAHVDTGLNVVGKSNTPEFGLQATTESLALGPAYNPWDLTRSPGGSSGGAGAAVASGMVPIAHGNDGGGSIRIPASCCGVFGLKPSRGRLIGSDDQFGLAVQGGLSRSVRDTAHLLAYTERKKPAPGLKPVGLVKGPVRKRLRIGMYLNGTRINEPAPDVLEAVHATAALCEELGHEVVETKLDFDGPRFIQEFLILWASEAGTVADQLEAELGRPVTLQDLEPLTMAFANQTRNGGLEKVPTAVEFLLATADRINEQFRAFDVMLCPVLSTAPPLVGEQGPTIPYDILIDRMIDYVAYTPIHNVTGAPAMSVPLFWNKAGLPIGSQFAAMPGDERTLLRLAYELEEARPWADRWPSMTPMTGE